MVSSDSSFFVNPTLAHHHDALSNPNWNSGDAAGRTVVPV
jgi:hypothetical protein